MRKVSSQTVGTISYVDPSVDFSDSSKLIINAETKFVSNKGNIFYNREPIELVKTAAFTLTGNYTLYEGIDKQFTYLGQGSEIKFQSFLIPSIAVEENSLKMTVANTTTGSVEFDWFEARNIFNITSKRNFFVEEDTSNEMMPRIIFGDGIIGNTISDTEIVTLDYKETKGSLANGEYIVSGVFDTSNFNTNSVTGGSGFVIANIQGLSDSNNLSYGGRDNETLEEIQAKAPRYFSTAGRGVTVEDFRSILTSYPYIMTSNVIGGNDLFPNVETELGNIYLTGVPFLNKDTFLTNNKLYLSKTEEDVLGKELEKFNIVSTKLNFFKPSYIYVDVQPVVELNRNVPIVTENRVKKDSKRDLIAYSKENFFQFASYFRASKLTAVMDTYPDVISSRIDCSYYFLINQDSFYPAGTSSANFISLPVIKNISNVVDAPAYRSFVKTNVERKNDLGLTDFDELPKEYRTLYGKLTSANTTRELYNEDSSGGYLSSLIVNGETQLFSFFHFKNNSSLPFSDFQKSGVELVINPLDGNFKDSFSIKVNGTDVGTVYRTTNPHFYDVVSSEGEFPIFEIVSDGNNKIVECVRSFDVSGDNKDFTRMNIGEFAIFDGTAAGSWKLTTDRGTVSAVTADGLYGTNQTNGIYLITQNGNGGGQLTHSAVSGDYIIFNVNSTSNPVYKWEFLTHRTISPLFDSTYRLPKEAIQFDLKLIINQDASASNFSGRTSTTFYHNDLIYFNSEDDNKWLKLVNIGSTGEMAALPTLAGELDQLRYMDYSSTGASAVQIGDTYRVTGYGNFSLYDKIIWPAGSDGIALENDILVYIGIATSGADDTRGTWKIFQSLLSYQFEVDSRYVNEIPIELAYGDYFDVISNESGGNFQGDTSDYYSNGEQIVYLGNNTWKKLIDLDVINASVFTGFPQIASQGDVLTVIEDGDFGNTVGSPYINTHIDFTDGRPFIDGDKIIFTETSSGGKWYKLNEYSFKYFVVDGDATTKNYLNDLGYNSVFKYKFNDSVKYYEVYFNDKFHNKIIGSFQYEQYDSSVNSSDVGKIYFEPFVTGNLNSLDSEIPTETNLIFSVGSKFDKITVVPRNKVDSAGTMILEQEEDFDTRFNQFLAVNIEEVIKQ
jgi:hypothetical protein